MSRKHAMAELLRMKATGLKGRSAGDADIDASLMVLAGELADHHEGDVTAGCREWARTHDWWPTLHELLEAVANEQVQREVRQRPRLPRPAPPTRTHDEIVADIERRMGWATDIRALCGGEMPMAWRRATADGPVIAVRWSEHGPWVAPGPRGKG